MEVSLIVYLKIVHDIKGENIIHKHSSYIVFKDDQTNGIHHHI